MREVTCLEAASRRAAVSCMVATKSSCSSRSPSSSRCFDRVRRPPAENTRDVNTHARARTHTRARAHTHLLLPWRRRPALSKPRPQILSRPAVISSSVWRISSRRRGPYRASQRLSETAGAREGETEAEAEADAEAEAEAEGGPGGGRSGSLAAATSVKNDRTRLVARH